MDAVPHIQFDVRTVSYPRPNPIGRFIGDHATLIWISL